MARASQEYVNNKSFLEALVERKRLIKEAESQGKEIPQISNYICECIMHICRRLSYSPNFINYPFKDEMIDDAILVCIMNVDKFDTNVISMVHNLPSDYDYNTLKGKRIYGRESNAWADYKSYSKKTKRLLGYIDESLQIKLKQKELVYFIDDNGVEQEFKLDKITYSNPFSFFTQAAWNAYVAKIKTEQDQAYIKASIFQSVATEFLDIQDHDTDENFNNGYVDYMKNNFYMNMDLSEHKKSKKKKKLIEDEEVIIE